MSDAGSIELLPECFWRTVLFVFKNPVEIGKIIETALVNYFANAMSCFDQHTGSMTKPDLRKGIYKNFTGAYLEIAA